MAMNITVMHSVQYLLNTVTNGDTQAPASGPVKYYHQSGTPPGRWYGKGLAALGIEVNDTVSRNQAERLFEHFLHPNQAGVSLGQRKSQLHNWGKQDSNSVSGYDFTFRIPKSISLVWGVADVNVQASIMACHDEAVRRALDWLEDNVAFTRSGKGGTVQVPIRGLLAARYDHFDTRNGDPHLHTHVAVANRVQRASDGKWLTIDGKQMFHDAVAVSELHESLLLDILHERLGMNFRERTRPDSRSTKAVVLDVDGVPTSLISAFSTRRANHRLRFDELLAQAQANSDGTPLSRRAINVLDQQAWRETRRPKDPNQLPLSAKTKAWRRQVHKYGFNPNQIVQDSLARDREQISPNLVTNDDSVMTKLAAIVVDSWANSPSIYSDRKSKPTDVDM